MIGDMKALRSCQRARNASSEREGGSDGRRKEGEAAPVIVKRRGNGFGIGTVGMERKRKES